MKMVIKVQQQEAVRLFFLIYRKAGSKSRRVWLGHQNIGRWVPSLSGVGLVANKVGVNFGDQGSNSAETMNIRCFVSPSA